MPCLSARCRATGRSRRCQSHPARQSSVIIQAETIRGLRASSEVKAARSLREGAATASANPISSDSCARKGMWYRPGLTWKGCAPRKFKVP